MPEVIIVWGSIISRPDQAGALLKLSEAHVQRSRGEPGCISHGAYLDPENPLRIVFYEEWQDQEALEQHFAVAASQRFVQQVRALAAAPPELKIYRAEPLG